MGGVSLPFIILSKNVNVIIIFGAHSIFNVVFATTFIKTQTTSAIRTNSYIVSGL